MLRTVKIFHIRAKTRQIKLHTGRLAQALGSNASYWEMVLVSKSTQLMSAGGT